MPSEIVTYEIIKEIFDKLPEVEKKRAAAAIGDRVFTWEEILKEVENRGPCAEKLLEKISELRK